MNRFLTRKKDKAPEVNAVKEKKPKKGKKGQPEPEPVLDLTAALPSTDDFRTSLIMPSLSTRFSMLREQDDPSSKLGKASDDSVLHPKRQSRLHEFGFMPGGLSDIAEVSSLPGGSFRPPFATERQDSHDSQNTEDSNGSVMARARPGEGNVLFGGRQKVYKISNTGGSGRVLYEDDVHLSAFQKLRLQEKERLREQELEMELELAAQEDQLSDPSSPVNDTDNPSMTEYSQKRETTSSTNSGHANARSSTAATSVSSQGANSIPAPSPSLSGTATPTSPTELNLNRTGTKARRLYDQALDQQMHEQQSSAMNRLNSLQRARAPTGRSTPPLAFVQTRSATNLSDRFARSTPPNGKDTQSNGSSPVVPRAQSPPLTSPLGSDFDDAHMLNLALQPNDRGKATAMGAFNKPKQAFSEQQYAERLRQLQQEREAPTPKPGNPRKPSLRERAESARQRSNSSTSKESPAPTRSRSGSAEKEDASAGAAEQAVPKSSNTAKAPTAFSVFERAANLMKSAGVSATSPPTTSPPTRPVPAPPTQAMPSPDSQQGATFFASPGSSDDETDTPEPAAGRPSDLERRPHNIPTASGPAPPILDHPALRSRSNTRGTDSEHPAFRSRSNSRPAPTLSPEVRSSPNDVSTDKSQEPDVDSPTLGPTNGGLSGLIRQHLRNVSTISSEFDDDSYSAMSPAPLATANRLPAPAQNDGLQPQQPSETNTAAHSGYSHSNPWDLDDLDNYGEGESVRSTSPVDAHKPKAHAAKGSNPLSTAQGVNDTIQEWEKEMKRTHKREPSMEEREAFQRELALRQRAIQESLRNKAQQSRSRNASPAPGGGLKTALDKLRAKSSKESFATTLEPGQPDSAKDRAMRMLGLGTNSANASNTSLAGPYANDHWRSEDRFGSRDAQMRQKPTRVLQQSEQDAQRELENRQRSATNDSNRDNMSNGRAPRASTSSSSRGRSSSEVSNGRSRSRQRQYRDDLEQAMTEGGSRNAYPPNTSPSTSGYSANTTQPLPAERPSLDTQGRMRSRSNSKTTSKHLQPIQTNYSATNGSSPHLTSAANSPMHHYPGMPVSPRPSPGAVSPSMNAYRSQASPVPPFSAHNTPPVSGTSTPVAPGFNAGAAAIMPSTASLRKKSINKADISDPIFLSTTSVIDTVNLPAGASLKNGTHTPPPLPPINPMRRRFGLGRSGSDDPTAQSPYTDTMYTNSSDTLASKPSRGKLRKTSSEGRSLHTKSQVQAGPSPAMPSMPFGARNGSPPRPINSNPSEQQNMDGAMF